MLELEGVHRVIFKFYYNESTLIPPYTIEERKQLVGRRRDNDRRIAELPTQNLGRVTLGDVLSELHESGFACGPMGTQQLIPPDEAAYSTRFFFAFWDIVGDWEREVPPIFERFTCTRSWMIDARFDEQELALRLRCREPQNI